MGKKLLVIICTLGIIAAGYFAWDNLGSPNPKTPVSQSPTSLPNDLAKDAPRVEIIAQNLEVPWDMAFLPNGAMLITERPGRIRLLSADGKLKPEPIAVLDNVNQSGESGLHGIALHPEFAENNFIYLYYTYAGTESNTLNRVSRFTFRDNTLQDEEIIVDEIPGASNHDGGRIRFGPDKLLYITTGDASEPSFAQNTDSLAGKILRVTETGDPAPNNPFDNRVFSYGHRNPQGITWDENGEIYSTEHGRSGIQSGLDELNRIEEGLNYGWPAIQGDQKQEGMIPPLLNSGTTTWAPSSAAYLNGAVFFTGLRGQSLYKASIAGDSATLESYFSEEYGRLRNVIVGPDGLLYLSTSNRDGRGRARENDDKILRVNPIKL